MDQNRIWEKYGWRGGEQNPRCLAVNTVLAGKYLVGPVLGEGGFGITYMGYDLNMKTRIAIKEYFPVELVSRDTTRLSEGGGSDRVISLSGEKSKTYRQGLQKYVDEARSVSRFSGTPGIVSVKDFFYENDTAYIVMEYIEGVSLKEYLKQKGGKLPEEEALAILRPVLEALEQVHEAGIVHRDISPDNIMLTFGEGDGSSGESGGSGNAPVSGRDKAAPSAGRASADGSGVVSETVHGNIAAVRLIDFGAARMTAKNDQKSLTIILKHGYAPEEQYRSHGEQGPWTDVYALCAVLYRMLTGTVPEPAMDRLFSDDLKRPEELGIDVSPAVSDAVMKGLAVKKDDRIRTVRELEDALYAGKRLKKERAKKRRTLITAALAAGLLAIVAVGLGIGAALTGGRTEPDASFARETKAQDSQDGQNSQSGPDGQAGGETAASPEDGSPDEVVLTFQEEELGEQIAFPSPQTSISGVQQSHTLFCLPDGSVKALGGNGYGQCLVQDWKNVVAVAASNRHSLGLRSDGKVYAAGWNENGQCETGSWHDIVAVAAGSRVSFGLRADGTVEACGDVARYAEEIASWTDIRAIAVTEDTAGLIGLDGSGTVHYAGFSQEMPQITGWEDVSWICVGRMQGGHLMGICGNGTVRRRQLAEDDVQMGLRHYEGVENWTDIQQLGANTPALGVKRDGTAAFLDTADPELQKELSGWTGLEAIASAYIWDRLLVFGLKQDGTILEYRQNRGNAELSDFHDLKWIQVTDGFEDGLAAVTADGRLLTYGLEYRLSAMAREMQDLGIDPGNLVGMAGTEGYLCGDGTLYGIDNLTDGSGQDRGLWSEKSIRQAVELWKGYYSDAATGAYALLTDDGRVKIRQIGEELAGTGAAPEEYLSAVKEAESWSDVVQIFGKNDALYALHADGAVSTTAAYAKESLEGVSGVQKLAGYAGAASTMEDILALMEDGTVRPLVLNDYSVEFGRTQVTGWKDVADIAVGESHVAGLLSNGTVVAAGSNHAGQCDVEGWENIVFLTAGRNCTLGITADGELMMAGSLY